jgi:integrase
MESLEQTKAGIRFKAPKTDRARAITLPSFAVEELRRLKREQAEALLQVGIRQSGDTLVCCREDGEPRLPNSLTNDFHYMMTRAKDLPRVRFHDLRHSHATQLLLEGVIRRSPRNDLGIRPSRPRSTCTAMSRTRCKSTLRNGSMRRGGGG